MTAQKTARAISALQELLGERLSTGTSILEMHSRDEAHSEPALPDAVVFQNARRKFQKFCTRHVVPVVPFGIGTSLEGHVIPIHGGISVDTSRMNKILTVHESDLDAVVQPGVSRSQLNDELRATGLMFTVDPGADATMGGMAATRASGTNTVIMAIQMGIPMARIELLDEVQMKGMNIFNPDLDLPEKPHLFLEFHGSDAGLKEQVEMFESLGDEFGASNFQWATKAEDRNRLWTARHNAYYAGKSLRKGCEGLVTNCCVPISALAECISRAKELVEESKMIAPIVGHVGDGNFHLMILFDPDVPDELKQAKALAALVNHLALSLGGTVTGKHGVGTGKKSYMTEEHGAAYALMATLKRAVDPGNIMNPGKTVDISD